MSTERNKGQSIIETLKTYTVIDLETTGKDPYFDDIIELSAVKVVDGEIKEHFAELVKPNRYYCLDDKDLAETDDYLVVDGKHIQYVSEFITSLTGITNKMLENARPIGTVMPEFIAFIGDDTLVGHNVNFDVNFIYDNLKEINGTYFQNDYIDTLRIARKVLPELEHHRLCDLAEHYKIENPNAHRAHNDCLVTNSVYRNLLSDIEAKYGDVEQGLDELWGKVVEDIKAKNRIRIKYSQSVKAADIKADSSQFDEDNPLFGMKCVITGTLQRYKRSEAMQVLANIGAINQDGINKETNYLIMGITDYSKVKDGKSGKQKKAEALILKGQDIQIITENVFYSILEE